MKVSSIFEKCNILRYQKSNFLHQIWIKKSCLDDFLGYFLDLKEKRAYLNVAFDDTFNQKSDMASLIATTQLSEFHAI